MGIKEHYTATITGKLYIFIQKNKLKNKKTNTKSEKTNENYVKTNVKTLKIKTN